MKHYINWNTELETQLKLMNNQNKSMDEISDYFDLIPPAITRKMRHLRIKLNNRANGKIWSKTEENLLKTLIEQKKTKAEIAILLNRSEEAIEGRIKKLKIPRMNHLSNEDINTIKELLSKNYSFAEIARYVGHASNVIAHNANRLNITNQSTIQRRQNNILLLDGRKICRKCNSIFDIKENQYENLCKECKKEINHISYKRMKENMTLEQCIKHKFKTSQLSSKNSNRPFDIDKEFLLELWHKQKGLCYYTKLPMEYKKGTRYCLSIDRVNSDKFYTKDNVVLCCDVINTMKCALYKEEFIKLCELIVANKENIIDKTVLNPLNHTKAINAPI